MFKHNFYFKATLILLTMMLALPVSFADWPENAYSQKDLDKTIQLLFGDNPITVSDQITIKIPEIAENGAVVPVGVSSKLSDIESITILVEKNPSPLVANFKLMNNQEGTVHTRIKLGKPSDVIAIVRAGGKLYSSKKFVKVTIPGCGGGADTERTSSKSTGL